MQIFVRAQFGADAMRFSQHTALDENFAACKLHLAVGCRTPKRPYDKSPFRELPVGVLHTDLRRIAAACGADSDGRCIAGTVAHNNRRIFRDHLIRSRAWHRTERKDTRCKACEDAAGKCMRRKGILRTSTMFHDGVLLSLKTIRTNVHLGARMRRLSMKPHR